MLIMTDEEPFAMIPGPAGTQLGSMHGFERSVTRAAALPLTFTLGEHGGTIVSGSAG
jgi:hypothetical protein